MSDGQAWQQGGAVREARDVPIERVGEVVELVREFGPIKGNAVVALVRGRRTDTLAALRAAEAAGGLRSTPDGWVAVGTMREPASRGRCVGDGDGAGVLGPVRAAVVQRERRVLRALLADRRRAGTA
jgi:hypothetical protein